MCGNPKVGSESVFLKPNRAQKIKPEVRFSVAFWKTENLTENFRATTLVMMVNKQQESKVTNL
jgi:hypothetical protein